MARRATLVYAALAAADTLLAARGQGRRRWLTKPLLMPVLMAGRDRRAQRALALVSFLGGHVAWIIACASVPAAGTCAPGRPWPRRTCSDHHGPP